MTSEGGHGQHSGTDERELTHFAEPSASEHPAANNAEPDHRDQFAALEPSAIGDSDWSEPTLSVGTHVDAAPEAQPALDFGEQLPLPDAAEVVPDTDPVPEVDLPPELELALDLEQAPEVPELEQPVHVEEPVQLEQPVQVEEPVQLDAPPEPPPPSFFVPARRQRVRYERGQVASWHAELIERAADVAVAAMPIPLRVLDVGCGDGHLLAELILRVPYADWYVGVDPAPGVISAARRASDPRLTLVQGAAESLPFADASFDLVLATMSFGYWPDQRAGAEELARVVSDNGRVVVVEPTSGGGLKGKNRARTPKQISDLLADAGLVVDRTEVVYRSPLRLPMARAFIASP
jgi:SAM-dependent methyltransferase